MLQPVSRNTAQTMGLTAKHDETKPQLPSKEKRETICGLEIFTKPFTIKPCSEYFYGKPSTFKPVRVISRAQLPLTFLDTSPDDNFVTNGLFSANIDVLENHNGSSGKGDEPPRVLVARHESKRTLYAIERVQARVYSICKLASWLKEKDVEDLWDPSTLWGYPAPARVEKLVAVDGQWWHHAIVKTQPEERLAKCARMSMLRANPKPKPIASGSVPQHDRQSLQAYPENENAAIEANISSAMSMEPPSPQEQLESLVQQYLNAVYMSKMSLAYLAKGPVTRIRTAFTSPDEDAPPTHELVTFLRSMLLSHKASERKYQEKLPAIIKSIPPGCISDEELAEGIWKPKKSKKKIKLNREGVYPQEEEIVKRWWTAELLNADAYLEETIDQRIKRRIRELRVREALAQMILMLEIKALESLSTYRPPPDENRDARDQTHAQDGSQAKPRKRKKRLEDINLLLDLLLDKLLIWQSTEEVGILDFDTKPSKQGGDTSAKGDNSNDRLQSFCVEVVVPFYMSRLPDQAIVINKKLGGPVHISPPKRKAMKPPTTSRKPGEIKEPETKKLRRGIGRVDLDNASKTSERRPAPSLNRATTDSALINGIKREGSEVPLSAIPFQRSPSAAARQSMSQFKHLKGREIDLTTTSAAATAKMKQKQRVEEDLKEAISVLKKPNRGLAAGNYADDIERRGISSANKSRKPANPMRKIVKDVQVSATPRVARRTKDMVERSPSHHHNPFIRPREVDAPPLSDFCIPSSAVRPTSSVVSGTVHGRVMPQKLPGLSVAETPSKAPSSKTFVSGAARRAVFVTPSKSRATFSDISIGATEDVLGTPFQGTTSSPPINTTTPHLVVTPPTKYAAAPFAESPPRSNPVRKGEEPSIYDALGWNDDDDDLL